MAYFRLRISGLAIAVSVVGLMPASAQLPASSPLPLNVPAPRLIATATKVSEPPAIDGLLNEDMWQGASTLGGFVQAEPLEGLPGSESTEVRLTYDEEGDSIVANSH